MAALTGHQNDYYYSTTADYQNHQQVPGNLPEPNTLIYDPYFGPLRAWLESYHGTPVYSACVQEANAQIAHAVAEFANQSREHNAVPPSDNVAVYGNDPRGAAIYLDSSASCDSYGLQYSSQPSTQSPVVDYGAPQPPLDARRRQRSIRSGDQRTRLGCENNGSDWITRQMVGGGACALSRGLHLTS
ncbi:hypothetical protein K402DRAFT_88702 [Aulographum hederae CBS 113979]|uniref:Uncharacterized protein n=1 Tax=Aulographum hederae CBS 113979 TaxID=1176131 RepID=A0A6G1H078_9PEZI|nr:hypothetical protein K402DRAFT_88702 [Aulographum hederae CBS 113979]